MIGRAAGMTTAIAGGVVAVVIAAAVIGVAGEGEQTPAPPAAACVADVARTSGQKAFPTAEGFGRFARGGRGGAVYAVTTLADAGPGSLRACAEADGPRTCVFRVSGTIAVDSWISVQNPYLTIAGQTSPGGIAIKLGHSTNTPLLVQTHDVIIRGLRLRPGAAETPSENVDTIQISGGAHDVMLDHLSTSWPTDEGINIVGDGHLQRPCKDTRNVTVQWSVLSEGLNQSNRGPHSRGTYFGYGARDITFHHNLIANNDRRNPLLNTRGRFDMINNVIYNSMRYNGEFYTRFGDLSVNAIGNVGIVGPSTVKNTQFYLFRYFRDYPAKFAIYLHGNLDIHRPTNTGDERLVMPPDDWPHVVGSPIGALSIPADAITGPGQAYRDVMRRAGAFARDAADRRLFADTASCRGAIIDDPREVGGWPVLAGPPPPIDSDGDGMPDEWEVAHGLNPHDAADRNADRTGDGYTNLEKYLDSLVVEAPAEAGDAGHDPDVTCGFPIRQVSALPVVRIRASPATIVPGGESTIRWTGERLRLCKAFGLPLPTEGSHVVRPSKTKTYDIHCTGSGGGDAIDSVVVTVAPAPHR